MAATYGSNMFLLIHKKLWQFVRQFINEIKKKSGIFNINLIS